MDKSAIDKYIAQQRDIDRLKDASISELYDSVDIDALTTQEKERILEYLETKKATSNYLYFDLRIQLKHERRRKMEN